MAQVANNADDYASTRVGIFFPGVVPALDGQCVSLIKWFMQEMSNVPDPQAPRGNGNQIGKTLVKQGHAFEVPFVQRVRGDIVCYEYGVFGHTGVILSGNRTFESNVKWAGVPSKIINGTRVYASRIGSMTESFRHDMHIYRLKSYNETGENMDTKVKAKQLGDIHRAMTGSEISQKDLDFYIGRPDGVVELTYGLFPAVAKYRETIGLLTKERDDVLYPYVEAVSAALGIPANALKLVTVTDAIKALKTGDNPDIQVLEPGDYRVENK